VVKLHCFVGMTHPEIAEVLQVSDTSPSNTPLSGGGSR
jgi:hypothetical protein